MRLVEAYFVWGRVTVTRLDAVLASLVDQADIALFARLASRGAAITRLNELELV